MNTRTLILFAASLTLAGQERGAQSVPGTGIIDQPGNYVLVANGNARASMAIAITASGVSLDLNGHELSGPGGLRGTGIQIRGASGVRVFNGTLANNAFNVVVENSANVELRNLLIRGQGIAVAAPPPEVGIMIVQSRNVVVENNAIYNVGLGVFVRGSRSWGNRIANNTITAGSNGLLGVCYNPAPGDPGTPRGDLISGNLITGFNTGVQFTMPSRANILRDNAIAYLMMAVENQTGMNEDVNNAKVQLR
jgi:parallel beta-helix repeat protein